MLFKNIPIRQNKFINYLAASTFGVLLIHANGRIMVNWLWNVAFKNPTFYGKTILPLHLLVAVISVYSVCIIIDKARIKFLEKPLFTRLDTNLNVTPVNVSDRLNDVFVTEDGMEVHSDIGLYERFLGKPSDA